jgi:hypothetical protein
MADEMERPKEAESKATPSPDSKEARLEAVREEREKIRSDRRALSAKKAAGALAKFVRGNIVTVVIALFLPSILGMAFFMGLSRLIDPSSTFRWGWGMAGVYLGLLLNIPWAKYMAPRLDRKVGKGAAPEEQPA